MALQQTSGTTADAILWRAQRRADTLVLGILVWGMVVAVGLGALYGPWGTGLVVALAIVALGGAAFALAPGSLLSRCVLAACGMLMVGLHIQLAMGRTEMHFGVFVFLAFLLIYRDWRPIAVAAATIAVHHLVFDQLQGMGLPVYCLTAPSLWIVIVHAVFVVVQTGVEVFMALRMAQDARSAAELETLCGVDPEGRLVLQADSVPVASATGRVVKDALVRLGHVVHEVHQSSDMVALASRKLSGDTRDLGERSQQVAQTLQSAAHAMEQLGEGARDSARQVQSAMALAHTASDTATQCGTLVRDVSDTMAQIRQGAREIADLVTTIDTFAFQTNLLALNAAVEAARAGDQGRGFAVVASEVRTLALQSAEAARAIRELTNASLQATAHGADTVQRTRARMEDMLDLSQQVCGLMDTVAQHVQQQSTEIEGASASVQDIDRMTQANAAMVVQSGEATDLLARQAHRLMAVAAEVAREPGSGGLPPAPGAEHGSDAEHGDDREGLDSADGAGHGHWSEHHGAHGADPDPRSGGAPSGWTSVLPAPA